MFDTVSDTLLAILDATSLTLSTTLVDFRFSLLVVSSTGLPALSSTFARAVAAPGEYGLLVPAFISFLSLGSTGFIDRSPSKNDTGIPIRRSKRGTRVTVAAAGAPGVVRTGN